tara:strand:- start:308 stop:760 length:453 start_codon:yes stop_codon:yes gene_type:complete
MIVSTTTAQQTFTVIPREFLASMWVNVIDESLNKTFNYYVDGGSVAEDTEGRKTFTINYVDGSGNSIYKEARFYALELFADFNYWNTNLSLWQAYDELWQVDSDQKQTIFKDRIFVTDQDIDQLNDNEHYNINNGQYTTNNSYNNEYIVV